MNLCIIFFMCCFLNLHAENGPTAPTQESAKGANGPYLPREQK